MLWSGLLLLCLHNVAAAWEHTDDDLMTFKTLPDVRAVKFDIEHLDRDRAAPGYWFVSPYLHFAPDGPTSAFEPFQVGPHIYDQDGRLVWTGSIMFDNHNVFDFRGINSFGNETHISMIQQFPFNDDHRGYGLVMNPNFEIIRKVALRGDLGLFDIHEFNVLDTGKSALVTTYTTQEISLEEYNRPDEKTQLEVGGFAELDLTTAQVLHEWKSYNQISLAETVHYSPLSRVEEDPGWDYVHINSVDKNSAGDYLLSMRFTNTLYMVSGADGHIMWRLNGRRNGEFDQDFIFSKQHDAKFLHSEGTHHIISLLNNASDEEFNDESVSSALVIEIETSTTPMTARAIRRYKRPDEDLTRLRGNAQVLPNKNMFACWSQGGYISEFTEDGELVMSARFTSPRFSNYRAYKNEFVGRPTLPPDMVASVHGTDETNLVTSIWVSWNGATEVATWSFYARKSQFDNPVFIGNVTKLDFETMFIARGYLDWITAEAIDRNGEALGSSNVHRTDFPDWDAVGWTGFSGELPKPQDPGVLYPSGDGVADENDIDNGPVPSSDGTAKAEVIKATQMLSKAQSAVRNIGGLFALVLLLAMMATVMGAFMLIRGWRVRFYQQVKLEEGLPEEETRLRQSEDD
ncbi:hypothetical protein N7509_010836 [Penicillium cosmopolitanum]|uniref:ASST-domain-containing protein n=1 Tax=Penicillium cosmopolitanum TaxID=1131564 RepID=A0A9X0B4Z3_9EURO|nr:uncharacterized protein N7509_010836 [Penicillium cosmopolitanum]KAJ5388295.1 hypothetical protein N7509_010836 [Penicillium cosmopolitanum]